MKIRKILLLIPLMIILESCSIAPENDYVNGEVGKYRRVSPLDPNGIWGVLITSPRIPVLGDK